VAQQLSAVAAMFARKVSVRHYPIENCLNKRNCRPSNPTRPAADRHDKIQYANDQQPGKDVPEHSN
jgi:hypothetical protein